MGARRGRPVAPAAWFNIFQNLAASMGLGKPMGRLLRRKMVNLLLALVLALAVAVTVLVVAVAAVAVAVAAVAVVVEERS